MAITNLRIQNIRCFTDQSFELAPNTNIIVGKNAQGKTTILESISLALLGKSFRDNTNFIQSGKEWARIDVYTSQNKQLVTKITNTKIEQQESNIHFVVFEPNELFMFYNSPSDRRNYIDEVIAQQQVQYRKTLANYKRILQQRNNLLKRPDNQDTMFVWNVRLSEVAKEIVQKRKEFIQTINEKISEKYGTIAGTPTKVEAIYETQLAIDEQYSTKLLKLLEENFNKDKALGHTTTGPHRDDIIFYTTGRGIKQVASRGEVRTILLSLKHIEAQELENAHTNGPKPVVLLDDAFSELDGTRRQNTTKLFADYQTIITTTDADIITKTYTQHSNIILL